jgi:hypothetical protein
MGDLLRGIGIWIELRPGITLGPVLIIIVSPTSCKSYSVTSCPILSSVVPELTRPSLGNALLRDANDPALGLLALLGTSVGLLPARVWLRRRMVLGQYDRVRLCQWRLNGLV